MSTDVVIGIDMGATHIRICIMDMSRNVLATERRKTQEIISNDFSKGLIRFCQEFSQDKQVHKIVVGLPAAISSDRQKVLSVPNLSLSLEELENIIPNLKQFFGCKVFLERDVNLQMTFDVYHFLLQDKLVLGAYLGTGMGFSIWNNGHIFIGANGVAGELGHIPYGDTRFKCGCGNYGCLETSCSGIALKNWYEHNKFDFPMELIFEKKLDDPFIEDYLEQIAKAISTTVNLFDPNNLILGGGVIDMPYFPLEKVKNAIGKYVRKPLPYKSLTILKAEASSFNGAIGAALYALNHRR